MERTFSQIVNAFMDRTHLHIHRVRKCIEVIAPLTSYSEELIERGRVHDLSKFSQDEFLPYVWLTEYHRSRNAGEQFEYPGGMAWQVDLAIKHHLTSNRHHPEFHEDANQMTDVDVIEMVCDWTAMAIEKGEVSAAKWASNAMNRFKFNRERESYIFDVILSLDHKIARVKDLTSVLTKQYI